MSATGEPRGFALKLFLHARWVLLPGWVLTPGQIVQQEEAARWLLTAVLAGQEPLPPPAEEELGSLLK